MQNVNELIPIIKDELSVKFKIPFGSNGMADTTNLIEAGMIDSFGIVELIGYLESRFDVMLHDEDLMSSELMSVSGMANLVVKRRVA